ncbi:PrsW family glutamic-type intramembrane protease [Kribbella sp. NPDC056951]|uniref:PrsW family glutamic-type intramembrane protease n=1 Tax=Kribbella sp. NPDC056951 TaxID=3345978 RepID=UPI00363A43B0
MTALGQSISRPAGKRDWAGLIGVAGSALTLVITLPKVTEAGGFGLFVNDVLAHGWTLLLLTLAAGTVRTLTLPTFLKTGFAGFFAAFGLAILVGRPTMNRLERMPQLGDVVVMPVVEEILKMLPVLLVAGFALRKKDVRLSVADIMLLGAWSGAGFALHENALFGRGGMDLGAAPPLSLLVPSALPIHTQAGSMLAGGHLLWTTLIALGFGITMLYRKGRLTWLALPVTAAVALGEHGICNAYSDASVRTPAKVAHVLLLGGWASLLLLVAGGIYIYLEWRLISRKRLPAARVPQWILPSAAERARRGQLLAFWQVGVHALKKTGATA